MVRNSPLAPDGFPFEGQFDPDGDGNVLEHFDRVNGPNEGGLDLAAGVPNSEYFTCPFTSGTAFSSPLKCSSGELTVEQQGVPLPKGLYYVNGKVSLNASDIGEAKITIVSRDQLKVTGSVAGVGGATAGGCVAETSGETLTLFTPYLNDLLFASQHFIGAANTKNAEDALTIEGSKSCFKGIIVAVNGRTPACR